MTYSDNIAGVNFGKIDQEIDAAVIPPCPCHQGTKVLVWEELVDALIPLNAVIVRDDRHPVEDSQDITPTGYFTDYCIGDITPAAIPIEYNRKRTFSCRDIEFQVKGGWRLRFDDHTVMNVPGVIKGGNRVFV